MILFNALSVVSNINSNFRSLKIAEEVSPTNHHIID